MKDSKYAVFIIDANGIRTPIVEFETKLWRVRTIARGIKQRPGRRVMITRDNKDLPGGANALDGIAYDRWLEERQPLPQSQSHAEERGSKAVTLKRKKGYNE